MVEFTVNTSYASEESKMSFITEKSSVCCSEPEKIALSASLFSRIEESPTKRCAYEYKPFLIFVNI
jgi:hypothetical protein